MMSISSTSFFSLSIPLLKETITRALIDQQQKVMAVAILAFSLFVILYFTCPRFLLNDDTVNSLSDGEIDSPHFTQREVPQNEETIYFYNKGERYYELTNFYENWRKGRLHYVIYQDLAWKTSEHAFQAEKFNWGNPEAQLVCQQIIHAPDAKSAFKIAQQNKTLMRPNWHSIKDDVMLEILRAKFQDEHLSNVLRKTGTRKLVEASPVDPYWGYGSDKRGLNRLGILLMQVRQERFGF